jgi:hypothetical protein
MSFFWWSRPPSLRENSFGKAIHGCGPQVLAQILRKQDFWTQNEF